MASGAVGLSFLVALLLFAALTVDQDGTTVNIAEWMVVGELEVNWAMEVDTLSEIGRAHV